MTATMPEKPMAMSQCKPHGCRPNDCSPNYDTVAVDAPLRFAWLEITGKCQLECVHCSADSGPWGTHGRMRLDDWQRVIDQLAAAGATAVQFIGGEPMLHPDLAALICHALAAGLEVEVYSNLVHIPEGMWPVLQQDRVSLATSYYSDDPAEHNAITGRRSHARTRANIDEAKRRRIPLRAGVIDMRHGQRSAAAVAELAAMGVTNAKIDNVRGIGRGARGAKPDVSQLCGRCASGVIAISPEGAVWPCVFSRHLPVGNVLDSDIADILNGPELAGVRGELQAEFDRRPAAAAQLAEA